MSALPPISPKANPAATPTSNGAGSGAAANGMPAVMPRGGVVSLAIKDRAGLYAAYMSFIQHGGIFVPSNRPYKIGEEVFLMLSLLDNPQKFPVSGRIVWLTPAGTPNKTPGIGIQFADDDPGRALKKTIEDLLGNALNAQRSTQTI